jgi:hypothetical protein
MPDVGGTSTYLTIWHVLAFNRAVTYADSMIMSDSITMGLGGLSRGVVRCLSPRPPAMGWGNCGSGVEGWS